MKRKPRRGVRGIFILGVPLDVILSTLFIQVVETRKFTKPSTIFELFVTPSPKRHPNEPATRFVFQNGIIFFVGQMRFLKANKLMSSGGRHNRPVLGCRKKLTHLISQPEPRTSLVYISLRQNRYQKRWREVVWRAEARVSSGIFFLQASRTVRRWADFAIDSVKRGGSSGANNLVDRRGRSSISFRKSEIFRFERLVLAWVGIRTRFGSAEF